MSRLSVYATSRCLQVGRFHQEQEHFTVHKFAIRQPHLDSQPLFPEYGKVMHSTEYTIDSVYPSYAIPSCALLWDANVASPHGI
jgi:hypothetical protein